MISPKIYSVTQINTYIEGLLKDDSLLQYVNVTGEVSNCTYHSSGHIYFSLKDSNSIIPAIMWRSSRESGLPFQLRAGDKVVVTGSVGASAKFGKYQLYARKIARAGVGDLYAKYEALKKELEERGLFSSIYKKEIPAYATKIGIVTAPTGAAVRDIVQISKRRNAYVQLFLYPALVQGEGAAPSIVAGIQALDALGLDVIIVGRGGGSIEDLWAFNEEIVAEAIFNCNTPIISAVGHETDTTIADFVADLRAPTPSAAAELAVFSYRELQQRLLEYQAKLDRTMDRSLALRAQQLNALRQRLMYLSPAYRLNEHRQRAVNLEDRLASTMAARLQQARSKLALYAGRLDGISPAKKLSQGYAYSMDAAGKRLASVAQVKKGDEISLYLSDGSLQAQVLEVSEAR